MKKNILPIALALLCVLLAGCGKKAASEGEPYRGIAPDTDDLSAITERTEYYDITVQSEHLFDFRLTKQNPQSQEQAIAAAMSGRNHVLVGTQFFQGEARPAVLTATAASPVSCRTEPKSQKTPL